LLVESGLPQGEGEKALAGLIDRSEVLLLSGGETPGVQSLSPDSYLMSADGYRQLWGRVEAEVEEYHRRYPLRSGMPREELKSRLNLPPKVFNALLAYASRQDGVVEEGSAVRLPRHRITLSTDQQRVVDRLLSEFAQNPYATPSVAECEAAVGPEVLAALVEEGRLVRVSDSVLFLSDTYEEMVARVGAHIQAEGSITVAQVRDLFQASRKYALALMEFLDEQRITKRVGDTRVLR
jgi:selenocysteine-specific elongation factor